VRLVAQIHVTVSSEGVRRDPTLMERVRRRLGGTVDLETAEVQNQLEATAIVDAVRRELGRLGVTNALSLVVDETVVFQDADGRPGDLPDLVLALADHVSLFGRGFRELRFAAEHEEAGLHLVIETRARTRHRREEPAAVVSVGGRIRELEARSGESAEAYRARVAPRLEEASSFAAAKAAFESFTARLRDALQGALPEARVDERRADARLVKEPERAEAAPARVRREPMHPAYDPFALYYPSPLGTMLDAMMFASFMHMIMPPPVLVVSPLGAPIGSVEEIQSRPDLLLSSAGDGALSDDHLDSGGADDLDGAGGDEDGGSAWDEGGGAWDDGDGGGWDDGGGGGDDLI
jgi:hypothetical protein